jgi:CheY-like chemotaxis protein
MVNKVFIIDDDDISLFLSSLVLEESGFAAMVQTYTSADAALQQLSDSEETDLPEVILLDLNMPGKSGWEFLETLTQSEKKFQNRTIVFILTSSIAASDKARSNNFHLVKGFLHKPLDEASLDYIKQVCQGESR